MSTAGCNKGFFSCIFCSEKQHIFDWLVWVWVRVRVRVRVRV